MKTKTRLLALTAAMALTAATAPSAWALQTEFVATGTIYDSYDPTGAFGSASTSLDGDAYTATAYIDTSLGKLTTRPEYNQQMVFGGATYNTSSPVYMILTINGETVSFGQRDDAYVSQAEVNSPGQGLPGGGVFAQAESNITYSFLQLSAYFTDLAAPSMLGTPFDLAQSNSPFNSGSYFQIDDASGNALAHGELTISEISSPGVISAAPEPSAWALLLAGVGLSGLALRLGRRRDWAMA